MAYPWFYGLQCQIVTIEPSHLKTILATDFQKWEKGPSAFVWERAQQLSTTIGEIWRHRAQSVLGSGVFAADGDLWKSVFALA